MRKLASIQRVETIIPIEGADKIELARIGGWQCVVKKGEFKAGDLGVYLEIDAIPPDNELFNWLWQSPKSAEPTPRPSNFRIKTKKMRGALSQGLLMPIGNDTVITPMHVALRLRFPDGRPTGRIIGEGLDVTEALGVTKYEPPPPKVPGSRNHARRVSDFPTYLVPKTDEERVQSCKKVLLELAGKPWIATLKCDGMSATYAYDHLTRKEFVACSRNFMVAVEEDNVWGRLALKYGLREKLSEPGMQHLAIQAEVVGPSAQGNPMGLPEDDLRVFTVFDTIQHKPLTYKETKKVCDRLGLTMVPVLFEGDSFYPELLEAKKLYDQATNVSLNVDATEEKVRELREEAGRIVTKVLEDLLAKAEGKYDGTKNEREGLVIRGRDEVLHSTALFGPLSFKVISNRYLLAEKD